MMLGLGSKMRLSSLVREWFGSKGCVSRCSFNKHVCCLWVVLGHRLEFN